MSTNNARVAWITPILGRGGHLMYMGPLLRRLSLECGEFKVFTAEYGGDYDAAGFEITTCGPIRRIHLGGNQAVYAPIIQVIGPGIISHIVKYRPDLMILNEFGFLTLYCSLLKAFRRNIRVLLIVENRPVSTGRGLVGWARSLFRKSIVRMADAVLTNNDSGKRYLIDDLNVQSGKIVSRPYLVSDMSSLVQEKGNKSPQAKQHVANSRIRFLYVGELIERKGLQYALKACSRLQSKHPEDFALEIVGDGPYRPVLEAMAVKCNLEQIVTFHGRQPYESLPRYYEQADVFLFPTLADYRALAPFEALSFGLPILASRRDGGSNETVREGVNGYSFDPENVEYMASLMSRVIENIELISSFSNESLTISSAYTLPSAVDALVTACDLAIGS